MLGEYGLTSVSEHVIELTLEVPVNQKSYLIPYAMRDKVEYKVKRMLQEGQIRHSNSLYNAPIVLVRKRDGKIRFCTDYGHLGYITKFDAEPMPSVEEIMTKLSGKRYLSKFWQIHVAASSGKYTAFSTPQGHFV